MVHQILLSDLSHMSESEREEQLSALVRAARQPSDAARSLLNSRIREFELRYEMSSETLLQKLRKGEVKETADIARWLFLLEASRPRVPG